MINTNSINPLVGSDHGKVLQLFERMPRQHAHLDWHSLSQWLGHPGLRCWVVSRNGSMEALLGATVERLPGDSSATAWLRFAIPPGWGVRASVFSELWDALKSDLYATGVRLIGLLDIEEWMGRYAQSWGFSQTNAVITLRRESRTLPLKPCIDGTIKAWSLRDLDAVVQIDTTAFDPLWRYNQDDITAAAQQAATFTVAELDGEMVGYQLSTRYAGSGHLARLAVLPEYQGRQYGGALIYQMLRFFMTRNISTVTVNTQADNIRSQRLYQRYGFELAGHQVPVWTVTL